MCNRLSKVETGSHVAELCVAPVSYEITVHICQFVCVCVCVSDSWETAEFINCITDNKPTLVGLSVELPDFIVPVGAGLCFFIA